MSEDTLLKASPITRLTSKLSKLEQAAIDNLIHGAYQLTVKLARLLPSRQMLALGAALGRLAGNFCGRELSFSLSQLAFAFPPSQPETTTMNYRRIALAGFAHAGEYLAELHILDRLIPAVVNGEIATFEGLEVLDEILRLKVPAICLGTHIGPFELVAANMAARGIPITVFAQTPRQRALKPILADIHASAGFQVIWRDDPGAAAKILRGIKDNRALCALLDQDTTLENHFVPLFGLPAAHPALPVKLGVKYGLPIVLCSAIRVSRMKYHFRYQRICYEDFLEQWDASHPEKELPSADVNQLEQHNAHDTVSREPTIEERRAQIEATAVAAQEAIGASKKRAAMRLQAAIDFVITTFATNTERDLRDHPDQWYWWHRRWRRRPGVNYDKHPDQLRSSTEYLLWLETKREQKMRGIELGND